MLSKSFSSVRIVDIGQAVRFEALTSNTNLKYVF